MKKMIIVALIMLGLFTMTGCGNNNRGGCSSTISTMNMSQL